MAKPFTLMPLPYNVSALRPVISARALELHHGKHHRAYVDKLNKLVKDTPYAHMPLEEIIRKTAGDDGAKKIFNNAGQVWNHDFFWHSMTPGGSQPDSRIKAQLVSDFGSVDQFAETFVKCGVEHFGSGWVWLSAANDGGLKIVDTHDAKSPLVDGHRPLFCCDLWEHAYYLDYQNDREGFLHDFLSRLADWDFAAQQYATRAAAE
jgi:Fe-Mn family superoxide dismutase